MPEETSIKLFKQLVESYDKLAIDSPTSREAFPFPDFDELFQQLKKKVASIDLLESARANLPILVELQELMLKLSRPKAPSSISNMVLDL